MAGPRGVTATVTVSAGGGGGNQNPTAQINGPYIGTVGTAISFSSASSSDPDGTIASFSWSFGDNSGSAVANPSKSYAAAGTYPVTLTVTDNRGATRGPDHRHDYDRSRERTGVDQHVRAFDGAFQAYPVQISLNLTQDLSQTPGPEAIQSFVVDSLVWDPAVLQFHSLVFGSGGGSFNTTNAVGGCKCKLGFGFADGEHRPGEHRAGPAQADRPGRERGRGPHLPRTGGQYADPGVFQLYGRDFRD